MSESAKTSVLCGLETPLVDTDDLSYQISKDFKPDKQSTWVRPTETDGWTLAHNAIRGELSDMKSVLQHLSGRELELWEIESLKAWFAHHKVHIENHHYNEDDIVTPFMKTRINMPDKLTTDHKGLVTHMENLTRLFAELDSKKTVTELSVEWEAYELSMLPHLYEEEKVALPLLRAYFTSGEYAPVLKKIISQVPKVALGAFWYYNFATNAEGGPVDGKTTKAGMMAFMKDENIPWFVYHLAFKGQLSAFKKTQLNHIDALISGDLPSASKKPGCFSRAPRSSTYQTKQKHETGVSSQTKTAEVVLTSPELTQDPTATSAAAA